MLCACIDIGSNTTRLLVADVRDGALTEVLVRRAFTRLGRELRATGAVSASKVAEVADLVAEHRALAERAGAEAIATVATAAFRSASNRKELVAAVRERAHVEVNVLDGEQEARLAFVGATRTLAAAPAGKVGVVDVGGGSTEIAVGTLAGGVEWSVSIGVGSGLLADAHLRADPPSKAELDAVRDHVAGCLAGVDVPRTQHAVAVGGSATSVCRMAGESLDGPAIQRALGILCGSPAAAVAREYDLDVERARLLPAGLLALSACAGALGRPLQVGRGGIREGVCLELAGSLAA